MSDYKPHKAYGICKGCYKPIEYLREVLEIRKVGNGTMTSFSRAPYYHKECEQTNTVKMVDNKDGSTSVYF